MSRKFKEPPFPLDVFPTQGSSSNRKRFKLSPEAAGLGLSKTKEEEINNLPHAQSFGVD